MDPGKTAAGFHNHIYFLCNCLIRNIIQVALRIFFLLVYRRRKDVVLKDHRANGKFNRVCRGQGMAEHRFKRADR